jgi:pimeloyl-ACP methyl ester carboxylesterase
MTLDQSYDDPTMSDHRPGLSYVPSSDGLQLAVHDLGGPDDPLAPVLLFSHATGFHGRVWEPMAEQLLPTYRCLAIDHRGHGLTETPEGTSLDWSRMGDDVVAVIDSELIGPGRMMHGIGHSMGGAALALAALQRPNAFQSLWLYEPVIVPPGALPPEAAPNFMADRAARRKASFPSFEAAVANFAAKPPLNELHPQALRAYVEGGFATRADGSVQILCRPEAEAAVYRGAAESNAFDAIIQLELPVAIAVGRPGTFGPAAFAPRVLSSLRHGTAIEPSDRGHFGPLEDPNGTADDVAQWLER